MSHTRGITQADLMYGVLYAIQVEGGGPIKIGSTLISAERRRTAMQQACPYRLVVLAEWKGTQADEIEIHNRLAPYRLRAEWYHPVRPVLDLIANLASRQDRRAS